MDNDRRTEDARLGRIEKSVMDLHAKVNNGLTERGKRTEQMVEGLQEKAVAADSKLVNHIADNTASNRVINKVLNDITIGQDKLATIHEKAVKAKNRMLVVVIGSLLSAMGWLVINSEQIGNIVTHLTRDL